MTKKQKLVSIGCWFFSILAMSLGFSYSLRLASCNDYQANIERYSDKMSKNLSMYQLYQNIEWTNLDRKNVSLSGEKMLLNINDHGFKTNIENYEKQCFLKYQRVALVHILEGYKKRLAVRKFLFKEDQSTTWIDTLIDKTMASISRSDFTN